MAEAGSDGLTTKVRLEWTLPNDEQMRRLLTSFDPSEGLDEIRVVFGRHETAHGQPHELSVDAKRPSRAGARRVIRMEQRQVHSIGHDDDALRWRRMHSDGVEPGLMAHS